MTQRIGFQLTGQPLCAGTGKKPSVTEDLSHVQGQLASTVSHMRGGAQQVLDSFCGLYIKEPRQVTWHAHHHLGGQMLVEAAYVALPQANGVEVGLSLPSLTLVLLTASSNPLPGKQGGFLLSLLSPDTYAEVACKDPCYSGRLSAHSVPCCWPQWLHPAVRTVLVCA